MTYAPDRYETDTGEIVGKTLAEAVAWAKANPAAFAKTYIWWVRDDDCEAVIVDRDIKDEIEAELDAEVAYSKATGFGDHAKIARLDAALAKTVA